MEFSASAFRGSTVITTALVHSSSPPGFVADEKDLSPNGRVKPHNGCVVRENDKIILLKRVYTSPVRRSNRVRRKGCAVVHRSKVGYRHSDPTYPKAVGRTTKRYTRCYPKSTGSTPVRTKTRDDSSWNPDGRIPDGPVTPNKPSTTSPTKLEFTSSNHITLSDNLSKADFFRPDGTPKRRLVVRITETPEIKRKLAEISRLQFPTGTNLGQMPEKDRVLRNEEEGLGLNPVSDDNCSNGSMYCEDSNPQPFDIVHDVLFDASDQGKSEDNLEDVVTGKKVPTPRRRRPLQAQQAVRADDSFLECVLGSDSSSSGTLDLDLDEYQPASIGSSRLLSASDVESIHSSDDLKDARDPADEVLCISPLPFETSDSSHEQSPLPEDGEANRQCLCPREFLPLDQSVSLEEFMVTPEHSSSDDSETSSQDFAFKDPFVCVRAGSSVSSRSPVNAHLDVTTMSPASQEKLQKLNCVSPVNGMRDVSVMRVSFSPVPSAFVPVNRTDPKLFDSTNLQDDVCIVNLTPSHKHYNNTKDKEPSPAYASQANSESPCSPGFTSYASKHSQLECHEQRASPRQSPLKSKACVTLPNPGVSSNVFSNSHSDFQDFSEFDFSSAQGPLFPDTFSPVSQIPSKVSPRSYPTESPSREGGLEENSSPAQFNGKSTAEETSLRHPGSSNSINLTTQDQEKCSKWIDMLESDKEYREKSLQKEIVDETVGLEQWMSASDFIANGKITLAKSVQRRSSIRIARRMSLLTLDADLKASGKTDADDSKQAENSEACWSKTSKTVTKTSKPVSKTSKPVSKTSKPVSKTTNPVSKTSNPVSKTSKPVSKTSKPVSKTSKPVSKTSKPVFKTSKPVSKTSKPVSKTSKPVSKTSKPVSKTSKPVSKTSNPVPKTSKPVPKQTGGCVKETTAAVKRGRGRPPKKRHQEMHQVVDSAAAKRDKGAVDVQDYSTFSESAKEIEKTIPQEPSSIDENLHCQFDTDRIIDEDVSKPKRWAMRRCDKQSRRLSARHRLVTRPLIGKSPNPVISKNSSSSTLVHEDMELSNTVAKLSGIELITTMDEFQCQFDDVTDPVKTKAQTKRPNKQPRRRSTRLSAIILPLSCESPATNTLDLDNATSKTENSDPVPSTLISAASTSVSTHSASEDENWKRFSIVPVAEGTETESSSASECIVSSGDEGRTRDKARSRRRRSARLLQLSLVSLDNDDDQPAVDPTAHGISSDPEQEIIVHGEGGSIISNDPSWSGVEGHRDTVTLDEDKGAEIDLNQVRISFSPADMSLDVDTQCTVIKDLSDVPATLDAGISATREGVKPEERSKRRKSSVQSYSLKTKPSKPKKLNKTEEEKVKELYVKRGENKPLKSNNLETIFEELHFNKSGGPLYTGSRKSKRAVSFPEHPWLPRKKKKTPLKSSGSKSKKMTPKDLNIDEKLEALLAEWTPASPGNAQSRHQTDDPFHHGNIENGSSVLQTERDTPTCRLSENPSALSVSFSVNNFAHLPPVENPDVRKLGLNGDVELELEATSPAKPKTDTPFKGTGHSGPYGALLNRLMKNRAVGRGGRGHGETVQE